MYTGTLKKINDVSRDIFGKESHELTPNELNEILTIIKA